MKTALLLLLMGGLSEAAAQASNEQLRAELGAPTTGWLIYSARTPAGDWDLFAARPDGSQTRNLTRTPESSEFYPRLSRDGTQMLYRRVEKNEVISGNRHGEQGVPVLARADGGEPRVLGGVGDLPWASWSPDGRQFVCLAPAGFSIVDALSGKTVRRFPRVGFFQQTTWSPDGRSILGVANSFGSGWSIARIDLATGQASAINRNDCCTPDWSPDGRNIIFSWRVPGQKTNDGQGWTQLWMTDVEGSEPRLLIAEDGRHIYGGCLSPDGRYAIFTGNAGEDGDPSSSGAPMQIMRVADAPLILGKSPAVRSAHPEAGDGPLVTLNPGWEPLWTHHDLFPEPKPPTPEGSIGSETLRSELKSRGWVAFSAPSNNDDWDLYVMRPDGSERRQFTNTPKTQEMGVRFSPDGKRMLYYRAPIGTIVENNNYGTFELVVADLVDSRSHSLGSGHTWASWLPDGKRLACLAVDGIHFIDSMTGRDLGGKIPRQGLVQQLVCSPDGRTLTGTGNGLGPFWNIGALPVNGGPVVAVSDTTRFNCTPDWMPDSRWILYAHGIVGGESGYAQLWRARFDGSRREPLYAEESTHIYGGSASPDGKYLLFTRSAEDLGGRENKRITMSVIRLEDAPMNVKAGSIEVPRLDLGDGWEPHWTAHELSIH